MKVADLIERLVEMPPTAEVMLHWDGSSRQSAEFLWLAQDGHIALSDLSQPVYNDGDRLSGAPSSAADPYLPVYRMLGLPDPDEDDGYLEIPR